MTFFIKCDSPVFWQTYLSDPASISMEGILMFNKHLRMPTCQMKIIRISTNPLRVMQMISALYLLF